MINSVLTINCDTCYGRGYIFFGDENDFGTEPCSCQFDDKLNDWNN